MPKNRHNTLMAIQLNILVESFAQTFILPLGQNITFEALYWFGKVGLAEAALLVLGAVAGCMANWGAGWGLEYLRQQRRQFFSDARYEKFGAYFRRYMVWLLPFFWQPLGALLVIAAGFFHVGWQKVLALVAIGAVLRVYVEFPAVLG